ncbi:MAG: hypothetical protein MJ153_03000 [Clostridia bacterium]|nr:hypothetical protein [Clostridia bacterium]
MRSESESMYEQIKTLEVGISNSSGGGYRVKYDLERRVINWTDEYMWNNNFMKTLSERKYALMREHLVQSGLLDWVQGYSEGKDSEFGKRVPTPANWNVNITFFDGTTVNAAANQHFPYKWNELRHIIEETSDCYFKLR